MMMQGGYMRKVKSHVCDRVAHRRDVGRRARKGLDVAEEKGLSDVEIAGVNPSRLGQTARTTSRLDFHEHNVGSVSPNPVSLARERTREIHPFGSADFRAYAISVWFEKSGYRNQAKPFNCSEG
jgi:hypothetical protein